jgi:integrase
MTKGLTTKRVAALKEPGRHKDGRDHPCLYLQITPAGVKSWLFRYQIGPRERWMGLGPLHTISLAEARVRARRYRQQLLDGIDPLDAKRKVAEAAAVAAFKDKTFEQVAAEYLKAHERDWGNAVHARQWEASLTQDCKAIAHLPIAAIDTSHILGVLRPIWDKKPTTASRTRGRIERVIAYAVAAKYRALGDGNPARWAGHLEELLADKTKAAKAKRERNGRKDHHHPALPYAELPAFMAELRARTSIAARALEFLIHVAARTQEATYARWDEVDADTWTVPGNRMKAGREHRVPLSSRSLDLLRALPREDGNPHLFVGTRQGAPLPIAAMADVLRAMRPGLTVHGFRSSFRTWAAEQTSYPTDVCEAALAHKTGNATEQAYQRGDLFEKRRKLMEAWSRYCSTKPVATGATVVALRKAR